MQSIQTNIDTLRNAIQSACASANRSEKDITLLAVSKTRSSAEILMAVEAGITDLGENYLQEAIEKIERLSAHNLNWHFIGPIQSNKTRAIARYFSWVHSLDRLKVARRLNQHCRELGRTLNICIQVNIDKEPQKSGVMPESLPEFIDHLDALECLHVRGLMAIPRVQAAEFERQKQAFDSLAELFRQTLHSAKLPNWDTLSMGMSGDFSAAIHAGATIVRIGSTIFGPRKNNQAS